MSNPLAILPQPRWVDVQNSELYNWLYKVWLKLRYTESDLNTTYNLVSDISASRIVTSTTTEIATDYTIVCNSATAMTVNLLSASGSNRTRQIKNINTGVVTVEGYGADSIDGELNQDLDEGDCLVIKDYASGKWAII